MRVRNDTWSSLRVPVWILLRGKTSFLLVWLATLSPPSSRL